MKKIFQTAPLRYVVPIFFVSMIAPYFFEELLFPNRIIIDDASIESLLAMIAAYIVPMIVLWIIWCREQTLPEVFGSIPKKQECIQLASLGIPLVALGFLTLYLLFYPLSLSHPEFVESWVLDMPEILKPMDSPADVRFNLANILVVVILAPILEEFVFRGFILGRLHKKIGMFWSIIITSILFAILHGEVLGAFIFSVFVCLIRFKFASLIAPIIVHISNNLLVTILVFIDQFIFNNVYEYTIEEFQSYWRWSFIGLVIGVPWLYWYYKNNLTKVYNSR